MTTVGTKLFDISGKVALVTGASSGLGRAMATALASAGADVFIAARRLEVLEEASKEIASQTGSTVTPLKADLGSFEGAEELANEVLARGGVDILINAAGVNFRQPVGDISVETWQQTLNLNLGIPFFLARHLVEPMKQKKWGRIVNIASLQSQRAFPDCLPYGASKGGITQLTRAMAQEWSKDGINCNAIGPGFFPTELTASVFANADLSAKLAHCTAIGRNGLVEDLHGATIFLSSPASNFITGQTLFVDGGFTAK